MLFGLIAVLGGIAYLAHNDQSYKPTTRSISRG